MSEQTNETTMTRAEAYLKRTEYLYDPGITDSERAEELPEHRQFITDLLFIVERKTEDYEQKISYARLRLKELRTKLKTALADNERLRKELSQSMKVVILPNDDSDFYIPESEK